jgi:hypothetical protein
MSDHYMARRVIGDRVGAVRRYPRHDDPVLFGRDQINVVESGASQRDASTPPVRDRCDHPGVDRVVHEHADRVV